MQKKYKYFGKPPSYFIHFAQSVIRRRKQKQRLENTGEYNYGWIFWCCFERRLCI